MRAEGLVSEVKVPLELVYIESLSANLKTSENHRT